MKSMNPYERVMIFIDGSNVFRSLHNFNVQNTDAFKIDYIKLRDELCSGRNLIRAYYYGSEDPSRGMHRKVFRIS